MKLKSVSTIAAAVLAATLSTASQAGPFDDLRKLFVIKPILPGTITGPWITIPSTVGSNPNIVQTTSPCAVYISVSNSSTSGSSSSSGSASASTDANGNCVTSATVSK